MQEVSSTAQWLIRAELGCSIGGARPTSVHAMEDAGTLLIDAAGQVASEELT
jgi:hypothetical protein